jgi:23S rRNA-intervening sequence protein
MWFREGGELSVERREMFGFEKLEVWHKAVEYIGTIYQVTRSFPDEERFGLTNQLRRCAVSVSSNITRGIIQIVCGGFQSFFGDCLRIVTGVCVGTQRGSKSTISWQRGV